MPQTPTVENVSPPTDTKASESKETGNKWYAWTPIAYGAEMAEGTNHIAKHLIVPVGDEVTQSKLNVSDEGWKELVSTRVVRKSPYPKTKRYEAPKRALIRRAAEAMEAALAGGE